MSEYESQEITFQKSVECENLFEKWLRHHDPFDGFLDSDEYGDAFIAWIDKETADG